MALKNNDVGGGGTSRHIARERLDGGAPARRRISSDRSAARRSAGRPRGGLASDPARHRCRADARPRAHAGRRGPARPRLSRPLLHRLGDFRARICSGASDGQPKTPPGPRRSAACRKTRSSRWRAASPAGARWSPARMSLQRAEHGEQPVWMAVVLAAMLGQIGLPGGGFAYALGLDLEHRQAAGGGAVAGTCRSGRNAIDDFIPVARIADMLLQAGRGVRLQRPASDLSRYPAGLLGRRQPVPPPSGSRAVARRVRPPGHGRRARIRVDGDRPPRRHRAAGDDHAGARGYRRRGRRSAAGRDAPGGPALRRGARRPRDLRRAGRAARLRASEFTEGRSPRQWLEHLYEPTRQRAGRARPQRARVRRVLGGRASWSCRPCRGTAASSAPSAATPTPRRCRRRAAGSRSSRRRSPASAIPTARAIRPGCRRSRAPGSPRAARFPLQLIANQPATRLHSQLDFGATSLASKIRGREPVRIHPARRRRARHRRRRSRAGLQRSRRLPRRRGAQRRGEPGRRAAGDRRVVRPGGSRPPRRRSACTAIRTC